jgi:hypothetical protein
MILKIPWQLLKDLGILSRALSGWGRADFLKTSAPLSFINTHRMNLIFIGSISLDSTFKDDVNVYSPSWLFALWNTCRNHLQIRRT